MCIFLNLLCCTCPPGVAQAACPELPLPGMLGVSAEPLAGGWAALTCDPVSTLVSPFSEHVVLSRCARGEWSVLEATCQASTSEIFRPCADPTPQPEMAAVNKSFTASTGEVATVFACEPGYAWLSGQAFAVTQCLNGNWTPIMDMCDTACPMPRDCSDISLLGFSSSGMYRITPSGNPLFGMKEVWCDLDDSSALTGGGWTTVFRRSAAVAFSAETEPAKWEAYEFGFGDNTTDNYFIESDANESPAGEEQHQAFCFSKRAPRLSHVRGRSGEARTGLLDLVDLSWNADGSPRPLVFQFLLDAGGELRHATFAGVQVAPPQEGYALLGPATYHGDAGDSFGPLVGFNVTLQKDQYWWAPEDPAEAQALRDSVGSDLTASTVTWAELGPDVALTSCIIRVRPLTYDEARSCPPLGVTAPRWISTEVNVPLSRDVGSAVSYACLGEYMWEGPEGGDRTRAGTLVCERPSETEPPRWNGTLTLPCSIVCPPEFQPNGPRTRCYHFSTVPEEDGVVGAALRCSDLGASPAVIPFGDFLSGAAPGAFYYTAHVDRSCATQMD
nr:uncharacterized protein LOC113802402 [Penaeus vannamei]